jgi:hypothetical protein
MGSQHPYTSSGSKSRDTRGTEPSQDDVRDELKKKSPKGKGLSGDSAGEESLDQGGASGTGSSGTRP